MSVRIDVLVGSIGTVYDVPVYDDDQAPANFDPSAATVKQLIFKMPGQDVLLTRTATAVQKTVDDTANVWCLRYTVVAADVQAYVDATTGGFHQAAGVVQIEPYLEFSSAQKWPGSTVKLDRRGRQLRVIARLSA